MRFAATIVLVIFLCGCGAKDSKPDPKPPSAAGETATTEPKKPAADAPAATDSNLADVVGRITLDGPIPGPRKLSINKDEETCGATDTVQDVVGSNGGVADVVIEIKGVEESADWDWGDPTGGYVIRQKDCQFIPNLVVMPNGKEISVYNDDPVGHNVNTGAWNQTQPPGPDPIVRPVEGQGPIKIGCNIHSWMEGWIYPAQSPFYAVTSDNGEFSISGVPPGKYRVSIWHAYLGRKTERVTLKAGKVETLNHEFKSK